LAGVDSFSGYFKFLKKGLVVRNLIAGNSHDHKTHFQLSEVLLMLKIAIDCDKYIKLVLS